MLKYVFNENNFEANFKSGRLHISGDEEYGIRPFQLLVSSIASCSGLVFSKILSKQRIAFESLEIEAEVERNPDLANKIEKISLFFKVTGKDLNEKRLLKNLSISRKNCSMVRSVEESILIEENLEIINLD